MGLNPIALTKLDDKNMFGVIFSPHHLPDVISQEEILFLHVKQLETVEKDFDVVHLRNKGLINTQLLKMNVI